MTESADNELLEQFARNDSETAFAMLAGRIAPGGSSPPSDLPDAGSTRRSGLRNAAAGGASQTEVP